MLFLTLLACKPRVILPPEITVDVSPVNMGVASMEAGVALRFDVQLSNIGDEDLILESVTIVGDSRCAFSWEGPDRTEIYSTESVFIRGHFQAPSPGEDQLGLVVHSNAENFPEFILPVCGLTVATDAEKETTSPIACQVPQDATDCADNVLL